MDPLYVLKHISPVPAIEPRIRRSFRIFKNFKNSRNKNKLLHKNANDISLKYLPKLV